MTDVVLAHHWLVTYRGGERVLAEFRRLFPHSPVATLVLQRGAIPDWIIGSKVYTSWIQSIPGASRIYKALLPLHPSAFGNLSVPPPAALILSSDAGMTKGLTYPAGAKHVCYCHSPPRYLWDMSDDYVAHTAGLGSVGRWLFRQITPAARTFDFDSAQKVDAFIANSHFVAARIQAHYNRKATVIYPPVSFEDFDFTAAEEDFYLLVSQLVSYKRVDIAVRAFTALGKKLVIIGEGSEFKALKRIAGPTVTLLGRQPFKVMKRYLETCRAFIHPQIEDFGITAIEAQAAGRPVIAFRGGGALETVREGETGLFFDEQSPESLCEAVLKFEAGSGLSREACRRHAEKFGRVRFRREIKDFLVATFPDQMADHPWPSDWDSLAPVEFESMGS